MGSRHAESGDELPELLTPERVAEWLGVTRDAVYKMVERAELPQDSVIKIGRRLRFDGASLRSWLAEKRGSARKSA